MLPNKDPYRNKDSFKHFIGYIHNGEIFPKLLCIKLPQLDGYAKHFNNNSNNNNNNNNNKYLNLLVNNKELLKKDNEIWDKISNL